jgi:hypothetical protein
MRPRGEAKHLWLWVTIGLNGLAASGWHTAAISMGLAVEVRPFGPHPLLGLGVDDLRWMMPVRPGDVLHLEGEVVELTPSRTKPQGIAKIKWTAYNQRGEAVYTFTPIGIVPRLPIRPPDLLNCQALAGGLRATSTGRVGYVGIPPQTPVCTENPVRAC